MLTLAPRTGEKPTTTNKIPHEQIDQNSPADVYASLKDRAFDFPHVTRCASKISVPGAEALWLETDQNHQCAHAFMIGNEFAHVHPSYDGSLHLMLSEEDVTELLAKGWGEPHIFAAIGMIPRNTMMVYAPRDNEEVDIVMDIIAASYEYAKHAVQ